ncbi:MAG: HAD hydrolase family protein [Verrucomicrobia bacterium]|nr:HAD hydrolase family protein [Verrucomicrobiota bacterium]
MPVTKKTNQSGSRISPALRKKLAGVKLLLCDVDGVLTDATVFVSEGSETKQFHIQDGLGQILLQKGGIKVGWISNRPSPVTEKRGRELKVDFLFQGKTSKVAAAEQILEQVGLTFAQVCYAGDDIVDVGVMKRAGVAIAVINAVAEAKEVADYVTEKHGGKGAIREIAELILKAQNKWTSVISDYVDK